MKPELEKLLIRSAVDAGTQGAGKPLLDFLDKNEENLTGVEIGEVAALAMDLQLATKSKNTDLKHGLIATGLAKIINMGRKN